MPTDTLLIADTINNTLLPGYYDLLGAASIFAGYGLGNTKMVIASQLPLELKYPGNYSGNIEFINVCNSDLIHPHPEFLSHFVTTLIQDVDPEFIVLPHTMRGCQIAANLSTQFNAPVISGINKIVFKEGGQLFSRSVMNGKWVAKLKPRTTPCIITVNQGAFASSEQSYKLPNPASVTIVPIEDQLEEYSLELTLSDSAESKIEDAEVIVAAGRGIGKEENLKLIQDLTEIFNNAAMGASRPLCDSGLLPYSLQVGETGRQVSPKVYIACGISGANQHINGIKGAQTIVAINNDSQAAIFNVADYGIIDKLEEFLPVLTEASAELKKD